MFGGVMDVVHVFSDSYGGINGQDGILTQIYNALTSENNNGIIGNIQAVWTSLLGVDDGTNKTGIYGMAQVVLDTIAGLPGQIMETILGEDNGYANLVDDFTKVLGVGFMDFIQGIGTFITSIYEFLGKVTSGDIISGLETLWAGLFGENGLIKGFESAISSTATGAVAGLLQLFGLNITPEQVK